MTRWRGRIGAERLEVLLAESLAAAQRGGAVAEKHFRRVTIDTTVQPKAVTHPTDSKLLHRGIEVLTRLARRHGVALRQSYLRVVKRAKRETRSAAARARGPRARARTRRWQPCGPRDRGGAGAGRGGRHAAPHRAVRPCDPA